ncbi:MAG: hypothetical protein A3J93_00860 [Candidatus Magasanikbacteria bacterium RIFOXYC2_FULL_42_28]|uniref:Response regulatory domain-containing protein n=1 Tax=Candidatus Magasanikbacteria bacterium RIFOXYC2_FULL_42_28 TaxID=1798704 RepID=A0A1F6NXT2_9BACT|nr:MAG: hypothetical protein A3J93_00860 [Candidatus Magasanikbacteria bacterium RIFOXYC2_FULL_42_28]
MNNKKVKILLIEDEPIITNMYVLKFKVEGLDLITADTFDSGRKMVAEIKPDLLLLDLQLDDNKSGFDILAEMKSNPATKNIPVYLLSNVRVAGNKEKGVAMGAIDFISKVDVRPDAVVKIVKAKLGSM